MTATVIDSPVFRRIFSSEPMRRVFSDEHRVQCYLDIEATPACVQARAGLIPHTTGTDEIAAQCTLDSIDMAKLKSQTELIGYPILPVVQQLVAACADDLGEYCHWGATTQDITDTATILQLQEALVLAEDDVIALSGHPADLARRYRDTLMAGRSNLQQAVPITFGYKAATWHATTPANTKNGSRKISLNALTGSECHDDPSRSLRGTDSTGKRFRYHHLLPVGSPDKVGGAGA
jgi:3-carboxy-cis,cis-muconate cycloisomerase